MALTDKLTDIADAIRAKTGGTAKLTLDEMPNEIAGITGAAAPTLQEKTITENGEYTADSGYDGLSKVTVNVPTGGGGECDKPHIIEVAELPTENIDENAVYLCGGAYYKYAKEFYDVVFNGSSYAEARDNYGLPIWFNIIPTKTTEGVLVFEVDGFAFYYIEDEDDFFVYHEGWHTVASVYGTDVIVVSNIAETSDEGLYAVILPGIEYYAERILFSSQKAS